MKKVLVVACVLVIVTAAANVYASPAVDKYIQAIAKLASPKAAIPTAPKGYGAMRDEQTGNFLLLVPPNYCGEDGPGYIIPLGTTRYGGQINGYCVEF